MTNSALIRPAWTPVTIAMMIIGFMIFWPLGLAMLAYILWGARIPEVRRHFEGMKREWNGNHRCGPRVRSRSGNVAFDEYRESELKRLEEERRKLDEELREFERFMSDLRRARDEEEFQSFRRARANQPRGNDADDNGNGKTIDL